MLRLDGPLDTVQRPGLPRLAELAPVPLLAPEPSREAPSKGHINLVPLLAGQPEIAAPVEGARPKTRTAFSADEVLIIGDSQAQGLNGALRRERSAARREGRHSPASGLRIHAEPGKQIDRLLPWIRSRAGQREIRGARMVMIQLGGNNISAWSTLGRSSSYAASTIADLRRVVREVRRIHPGVHVAVSEIPVRSRWIMAHRNPEKRLAVLDSVNAWIARGGDPSRRFEPFDVNDVVAYCDESPARLTGATCQEHGADYQNTQRAEFRRSGEPNVHLNGRGYDVALEAFVRQFLRSRGASPHARRPQS